MPCHKKKKKYCTVFCSAERASFFWGKRGGYSPSLTWLNARKCFSFKETFKPWCESVFIKCWPAKTAIFFCFHSFIIISGGKVINGERSCGFNTTALCEMLCNASEMSLVEGLAITLFLLCYMHIGHFGQCVFQQTQAKTVALNEQDATVEMNLLSATFFLHTFMHMENTVSRPITKQNVSPSSH